MGLNNRCLYFLKIWIFFLYLKSGWSFFLSLAYSSYINNFLKFSVCCVHWTSAEDRKLKSHFPWPRSLQSIGQWTSWPTVQILCAICSNGDIYTCKTSLAEALDPWQECQSRALAVVVFEPSLDSWVGLGRVTSSTEHFQVELITWIVMWYYESIVCSGNCR